ncbi:protein FANTASTIC FOUR 3-like [Tasmannia lanceolata]|uniref:protein FANTASTIC FOUR 3-like n=1 Tax=Tasmannia lanceolata TaxID=3420 RepID=UPI004062F340
MSSTVIQGLQSCLEPRLLEQRALLLKLFAPKPHVKKSENPTIKDQEKCNPSNPEKTFFSIQSLGNTCPNPNEPKQSFYLPPLSSLTLSKKSLELCTENLGCETGTDITQNTPLPFSSSYSSSVVGGERGERRIRQKNHPIPMYKRDNKGSFPPPLRSISGEGCIYVRPHREGGRLVIKAVTLPSSPTYFKAERSEGHLRLRFSNQYMYEEETEEEEEQEEREEEGGEKNDENDMNGNDINCGGEMGIEKFQRPRRCNESGNTYNKGILMRKPFCVASS